MPHEVSGISPLMCLVFLLHISANQEVVMLNSKNHYAVKPANSATCADGLYVTENTVEKWWRIAESNR